MPNTKKNFIFLSLVYKTSTLLLLFTALLSSCKYGEFVKYYFPSKKTHLAKFNKWDRFVGSNSNPLRTCYNVTFYDWVVHVDPPKENINANMKIHFKMDAEQDSIMLDFERHLKMDDIKCSVPLKKIRWKKDVLFVVFKENLKKGENAVLEISYHGTPIKLLNYSAITWKKDQNKKPWICSATEGLGPHHMMPCKDLLSDEADSCSIHLAVPKNLVGVSNGKLDSITETKEEKIYHWRVHNPINIYSLVLNVGDFVKLEKDYKDIAGVNRKIEFYALSYNKNKADSFYNQAPAIMQKLENIYGPYPWWRDGCKFLEACLTNGFSMEHQSAISMSEGYRNHIGQTNFTIVHELAHEWWGNSTTAFDYGELWLHESFAEYSEALYAEELFGRKLYNGFIQNFGNGSQNKRPVLKPSDLRYNCMVHDADQDIYAKGAVFLHTLRMQLGNDEMFFLILKKFQKKYIKQNVTTEEFIKFFNDETQRDFTPFFEVYLKQISPPKLQYKIIITKGDSMILEYKWKERLPDNFNMKVYFIVDDKPIVLYPKFQNQQFPFPTGRKNGFDLISSGYILLKEIKN